MIAIATAGLFSAILFTLAIVLLIRASAQRPPQLRAANFRSPEGYAYHHHRVAIRRQGWACAFAAVMTLAVVIAMSVVQLSYSGN